MNTFLNSLFEKLTTMEEKMQSLLGELDSIVSRIHQDKWKSLLVHLDQDYNKLLDKLSKPQRTGILTVPMVFSLQTLEIRPVTSEDSSRWRDAHKSDIRVVIGEGGVNVTTAAEVAIKYKTSVSQITPIAQQGCMVLNWEQYRKLLDEIGKLIHENRE
jgi:hypothetical protein